MGSEGDSGSMLIDCKTAGGGGGGSPGPGGQPKSANIREITKDPLQKNRDVIILS
jgi:hypothetical protein